MNLWQEYLRPASVAEAVQALTTAPAPVIPIAGGTDLMLDLQQGRHPPVHTLIDLTAIPEMRTLEVQDDFLFIGASVPVSRIARDPLVVTHARALIEACELIAGPQVRNVATLGGNIAHALPAADGTIALLALDTQAEIASPSEQRRVSLAELFAGPGKSTLQRDELLVGFYIPILKVTDDAKVASAFKRIMRPQGVALPILNLALRLARRGDMVEQIRIAVGPGGPTPWQAAAAEEALAGQLLTDATRAKALQALLGQVGFRSSPRRASADYRRQLVGVLLNETLEAAWERAA
jgi:CO/xanthine dehydrogenase FAD-binding subunit